MRLGFKKWLFICLCACLFMSHNTFAIEGLPSNTRIVTFYRGSQIRFKPNNTGSWLTNNSYYGFGINTGHGQGFKHVALNNSSVTIPYSAGRYLVIQGQAEFMSMYMGNFNVTGFLGIGAQDTNCPILHFESYPIVSENPDDTWTNTYNVPFTAVCRVLSDSNVSTNLELHAWSTSGATEAYIYFSSISLWEVTSTTSDINNSINAILTWLQNNSDNAGDVLSQEKQDVQDAADDAQDTADDYSTNSETTNLVGAFSGFVTALGNLRATNCNVTLPFPSNLGGNMTVNICQNKSYAGDIVSIFGSITLVIFYLPLALKLLSMIYNEIRSFTNG